MLPEDICLVIDDPAKRDTKLKRVLVKNSIIPVKVPTFSVEVGKTIVKDSDDEIMIMVVEGPSEKHSTTNKPIGILKISGQQINRDLIRGTEIDLTIEMSESRDLTVSAFLNGTGQEFSMVFEGKKRHVDSKLLAREVLELENTIQNEVEEALQNGNSDSAEGLDKLLSQLRGLIMESASLSADDVTDDRYKLEDKKRMLPRQYMNSQLQNV